MGSFVIGIILLIVAAGVITIPLVFHKAEAVTRLDSPVADFQERDALLDAMSELELSFGSGKISEPDYQRQKHALQREYLSVVGES